MYYQYFLALYEASYLSNHRQAIFRSKRSLKVSPTKTVQSYGVNDAARKHRVFVLYVSNQVYIHSRPNISLFESHGKKLIVFSDLHKSSFVTPGFVKSLAGSHIFLTKSLFNQWHFLEQDDAKLVAKLVLAAITFWNILFLCRSRRSFFFAEKREIDRCGGALPFASDAAIGARTTPFLYSKGVPLLEPQRYRFTWSPLASFPLAWATAL